MNSITNSTVIVWQSKLHTPSEAISVPLYNLVNRSVNRSVDSMIWNSLTAKIGVTVSLSVAASIIKKLDEYGQ